MARTPKARYGTNTESSFTVAASNLFMSITKTRLFKHIENFTAKFFRYKN